MIYINDMKRPFHDGMTISDAFRENNIKIRPGFLVFVNDEEIDFSEYDSFELHDEDDIQQMFPFLVE